MKHYKKLLYSGICSVVLSLFLIPQPTTTHASANNHSIRVALFVDTGKYYRYTVPKLSISSDQSVSISLKATNQNVVMDSINPGEVSRFSIDGYYVFVALTDDFNGAARISQQLGANKIPSYIQQYGKSYKIVTDTYADAGTINQTLSLVKQLGYSNAQVSHNMKMISNPFRDRDRVSEKVYELRSANIPAYMVISTQNGALFYHLVVEDELGSDADLLRNNINKILPNEQWSTEMPPNCLWVRTDVTSSSKINHYYFSKESVLIVNPSNNGTTMVEEKNNKKYRGAMEMRVLNDKLTLVNELPLDQYLYGVVGTEMSTGWPLEALKAQAVLARTRALNDQQKYIVADLSDSTYEQAYGGFNQEKEDIRKAVDETGNQVITYNGKPIQSLYYSNAGGITADASEIWGNDVPYLKPTGSPDAYPQEKADKWCKIMLNNGQIGYVYSNYVTNKSIVNAIGLRLGYINTNNVNMRKGPGSKFHDSSNLLSQGMSVIILEEAPEDNAFSWMRGPYDRAEIEKMLHKDVNSLEVSKKGSSGRVTQIKLNGEILTVSNPDQYRSLFKHNGESLYSTLFDIYDLSKYYVVSGARPTPNVHQGIVGRAVQSSKEKTVISSETAFIYDGQSVRDVHEHPQYVLMGKGYGHGVGMSQYGARQMAIEGQNYKEILEHYYRDISIDEVTK